MDQSPYWSCGDVRRPSAGAPRSRLRHDTSIHATRRDRPGGPCGAGIPGLEHCAKKRSGRCISRRTARVREHAHLRAARHNKAGVVRPLPGPGGPNVHIRVVCGRGRNTTISESVGPCGRLELDFAPQTAGYAAVGLVRQPRCQRPKGIFRPCSRRVALGSPPRQILHSTPNQRNPARRSRRRDAYRSISPLPQTTRRGAPRRGYRAGVKHGERPDPTALQGGESADVLRRGGWAAGGSPAP